MNTLPLQLLKQVDVLNEQQRIIENKKQLIIQKLSAYKKQIEKDNSFLVGKKWKKVHC